MSMGHIDSQCRLKERDDRNVTDAIRFVLTVCARGRALGSLGGAFISLPLDGLSTLLGDPTPLAVHGIFSPTFSRVDCPATCF
jgi:hypothetical protein